MRQQLPSALLMPFLYLGVLAGSATAQPLDVIQFSSTYYSVLENAGSVAIEIQRSGRMTDYAALTLRTVPGTADTNDFESFSRVVTLPPGQSNLTVLVSITNDALVEGTERFGVILTDPDPFCCQLGGTTEALVEINDNDRGVEFVPSVYTAREGERPGNLIDVEISVQRMGDATNEFAVDLEIRGTASGGADFILSTNRLFFPSGQSNVVTFLVSIPDDALVEGDEYISLYLTNATSGVGLGANSAARVDIYDNEYFHRGDPTFRNSLWFSSHEFSHDEGAASSYVTVIRGGESSSGLSVDFTTAGTAVPGLDFVPASGTVTFQPLETSKNIIFRSVDDCHVERNKSTQISLSNPSANVMISEPSSATLWIVDDELPGSLDAFNPSLDWLVAPADHGPGSSIALQGDGKIVVGHKGVLARLNPDGSQDMSFLHGQSICADDNQGLGRYCDVSCVAIQADGAILAGGYGGAIRVHANGAGDTNFIVEALSHGTHGGVYPESITSLLLQPDGGILALGTFLNINGHFCPGLARLNPDSTVDTNFISAISGVVRAAAVQSDGKIVAHFTSGRLFQSRWLARLNENGTMDTNFAVVSLGFAISAMAILPDQKILIVGASDVRGLARLNTDGSVDTTFNSAIVVDGSVLWNPHVFTIARDGCILVAGDFTDGTVRVVKLDPDGAVMAAFNNGVRFSGSISSTTEEPGYLINSIIEEPAGELLVAGSFDNVNGIPRPGIARLKSERSHMQLSPPARQANGSARITSGSQVGNTYVLQGSADLIAWTSLSTNVADDCTVEFEDPNPISARFYRVVKLEP